MYVNKAQKFFTYLGYYANVFARSSGREVERLTRPLEKGDWKEIAHRTGCTARLFFSVPLAAALLIPSLCGYLFAACAGRGRWEQIGPKESLEKWKERPVKVMSLNACLQDPWAPLTGGVVPPFALVGRGICRVDALVDAIALENPDVFLGQEFDHLGAQDRCISLLQKRGFRYFLRDLGSADPIRNHSGLFVASKIPLGNGEFVPYSNEDRAGLAKWSGQGALTFTLSLGAKQLRLVNVHLNYGDGEDNQAARNRQLARYALPLLHRGPSALLGDLNFDTGKVDRTASHLLGFVNALEGQATCTDAGKHALRGKEGAPCGECAMGIDGILYRPGTLEVLNPQVKPLMCGGFLLSDHYAATAILRV